MRISDWSSDVCSSDLMDGQAIFLRRRDQHAAARRAVQLGHDQPRHLRDFLENLDLAQRILPRGGVQHQHDVMRRRMTRSEEHTSELQSLMRYTYAAFCLTKKTIINEEYTQTSLST